MSSAIQCEIKSEPLEVEKFVFTYPNLPITLQDGKRYVISAWDTNVYIKGVDGSFEIVETYGNELEDGREYLLICPKY